MDHHWRKLRVWAAVLALIFTLRVLSGGFFQPASPVWEHPALLSFLLYLQTGRAVRLASSPTAPPAETQGSSPTEPAMTEAQLPVFSSGDLDLVSLTYGCDYRPELEPLLLSPLDWDLRGGTPKVLILHTHATEGYTPVPGQVYSEEEPYRTLDEQYNMLSIGDEVARLLEAGGIGVIHDRTLHDHPSYNDSYGNARATIERHLAENPEICLVLDLHRDAIDGAGDDQLVTVGTVGGQRSAQLMMVVGTDATGNYHPNWQENLALALKLTVQLEQENPGLTRPVSLREHRFNMDLTPGSLIVEVGGAGNTQAEALLAASALASAILSLAAGSQSQDFP